MERDPDGKPRLIERAPPRSLGQRLRGNFFAGVILVGPVALTIWIAWSVITLIDDTIVPWVPAAYNPETWLGNDVPGFGVIVFLVVTTLVGWLTRNLIGRQIVRFGEAWVARMPIIRSIYNALKQIAETVLSESKNNFQSACLIEWPRKGAWALGFVSTDAKGEVARKIGGGEDLVAIFMPTTPNPTTGFLVFLPRSEVVMLDMSLEEAAKMIISAGLVAPPADAGLPAGKALEAAE